MKKIIALVDCNNFFASCERVFNPLYQKKPIVILSNNDGCVISRSAEAKLLGIPMGIPYFKINALCEQHKVVVHSSNFELYGDMSKRVMTILSESAPSMEVYSIDEAFLDLSEIEDPYQFCQDLRKKILDWTGIPVSIGVAPTKTLAKVAAEIAKQRPLGVHHLASGALSDGVLRNTPVSEIWGIGRKWGMKLQQKLSIKSAYDLKIANAKFIRDHFSVTMERIVYELNGFSCLDMEALEAKKSITSSRSFSRPLREFEEVKAGIATFTATVAKRLRQQHSKAYAIYVYVRTDRFKNGVQHNVGKLIELDYATSDTLTLTRAAIRGLGSIFKDGYEYKKAGVVLLNIVPDNHLQQDIFVDYDETQMTQSSSLMKAMDDLNKKFGKSKIKYAAEGFKKDWWSKAERLSRKCTTRWDELIVVG